MAKAIMVQGTMSNAGKSLLCAGLCRVFHQDGYRVAPFKSQNMALNSFITREGLEMGRAQVVQAEAASIEPDVRMNPILLKPTSNVGSQVIVHGEVRGNMRAQAYYDVKPQLVPEILASYHSLAAEYDIIVLEGAGSPAEINLKENDIVNMGMARLAKAPVLLVGDIDRGGVFAQLVGTLALLDETEQDMVKGLVINKFRGDATLLKPDLDMLSDITHKPVVGVLPMLSVDIEEEDSLSPRWTRNNRDAVLDIAVIHLPRLSNYTDFAALEATPGVGLRYVKDAHALGQPDLVIVPGTKNTMDDLLWLRQSGLEAAMLKLHAGGTPLMGICGGYQMLGQTIDDLDGLEGGGSMQGLGLLPIATVFAGDKQRTRVTGRVQRIGGLFAPLQDAQVEGYEIHMGRTTYLDGALPLVQLATGQMDGCWQHNVYGTYLHGFLDTADVRARLLQALASKKGVSLDAPTFDLAQYKQQQYDALAQAVRSHLHMPAIYRILEQGM